MTILSNSVATKQVARSAKNLKLSQSGFVQLSIFEADPPPSVDSDTAHPRVTSELVPKDVQLAPGRRYAFIVQGNQRWNFPLQLTEFEVAALPVRLKHICLDLDACGKPYDIEEIYQALGYIPKNKRLR